MYGIRRDMCAALLGYQLYELWSEKAALNSVISIENTLVCLRCCRSDTNDVVFSSCRFAKERRARSGQPTTQPQAERPSNRRLMAVKRKRLKTNRQLSELHLPTSTFPRTFVSNWRRNAKRKATLSLKWTKWLSLQAINGENCQLKIKNLTKSWQGKIESGIWKR